ncbi:11432_t:CDS:2 [Funneliformis geosporum]|nr:11432_t:CDS:2 [Funneliformis geosporum]
MALFIGRLSLDTHPRDLEHIFDKYGRLNRLEVKRGYAFVEYQDERDASDAMKETDGLYAEIVLLLNGQKMVGENQPKISALNVVEKVIGQKIVVRAVEKDEGARVQEKERQLLGLGEVQFVKSARPYRQLYIEKHFIILKNWCLGQEDEPTYCIWNLIVPREELNAIQRLPESRSRSRSPKRSLTPARRDRDDRYYRRYSDDEKDRRHSHDDRRYSSDRTSSERGQS